MREPKDAMQALHLARRAEAARQILDAGYTFWTDTEVDTIYVCKPGRLFAEYQIHQGACDCPDFAKSGTGYCKHTLAANMKAEEDAAIDAQAAQWAEGQENAEDIEFGCFPY